MVGISATKDILMLKTIISIFLSLACTLNPISAPTTISEEIVPETPFYGNVDIHWEDSNILAVVDNKIVYLSQEPESGRTIIYSYDTKFDCLEKVGIIPDFQQRPNNIGYVGTKVYFNYFTTNGTRKLARINTENNSFAELYEQEDIWGITYSTTVDNKIYTLKFDMDNNSIIEVFDVPSGELREYPQNKKLLSISSYDGKVYVLSKDGYNKMFLEEFKGTTTEIIQVLTFVADELQFANIDCFQMLDASTFYIKNEYGDSNIFGIDGSRVPMVSGFRISSGFNNDNGKYIFFSSEPGIKPIMYGSETSFNIDIVEDEKVVDIASDINNPYRVFIRIQNSITLEEKAQILNTFVKPVEEDSDIEIISSDELADIHARLAGAMG